MLIRRLPTLAFALVLGAPVLAAIPGDSAIVSVLGISFLIFVHEWGHFFACRLTGTRTETFSIGFGPRVFGWEKDRDGNRRFTIGRRQLDARDHAMDFRVAAIPLGGYVKMAGEMPGERPPGTPPAPDEFPTKSAAARTLIISAGVIMNFVTAVVLYFVAHQFEKPYRPPVVGDVAEGGAAWQAGILPGDRILSIDGEATPTWIDLQMEIAFASASDATVVLVERDGERLPAIPVRPVYDEERGILQFGISSAMGLQVGTGSTALAIGFEEAATIAGVPVRGGAQAFTVLQRALLQGIAPVVIDKPSGERLEFTASADAPADPAVAVPSAKVGLAPYAPPVVKSVRGRARTVLEEGDQLIAAVAGSDRVALDSELDAQALAFRPAVRALVVLRADQEREVTVDLSSQADVVAFLGDVAFTSTVGNRVRPLTPGHRYFPGDALYRYPSSPARDAGIPPGARIVQVGTLVTRTWTDIHAALESAKAGEALPLTLRDADGNERTVEVVPVALERVGGVSLTILDQREHFRPGGIGNALAMGATRTVRETKNVFRTIGALFGGSISFNKNIAGPITLVTASKRFAEDSPLQLIWFLAYVSVMLAVLNILPIPVLDGGHLLFILIEKIKGSPLKDETVYRFQKVGMLLLLVLMVFAFKNDITRLIH